MKYPIGTKVKANSSAWPSKLVGQIGTVEEGPAENMIHVRFPEIEEREVVEYGGQGGRFGPGLWPMHDSEIEELK